VARWGLLLALAAAPLVAAATPRFGHLSVEHGLSQSTVQAIFQDRMGFLWLGTEEGLTRFDGYGTTVFLHDPEDPKSLPNNRVTVLFGDRKGRLWVGTDSGLARYDARQESFDRVSGVLPQRVNGLAEGADGTLWVAVEGAGLYALATDGEVTLHQHDAGNPYSLASYLPSRVLVDRQGRVWVGTHDAGLARLEPTPSGARFVHLRHREDAPDSLSHDDVWGLAEDQDGRLWVATYGGGVSVLDPDSGRFGHHRSGPPPRLGSDLATMVFTDRRGVVWIGTDGAGLQQYDPELGGFVAFRHAPGDPGSVASDVIRSIYEDRQGQIWVGTFLEGASHLRTTRHQLEYATHNPDDPRTLANGNVYAFAEDAAGRLWISTGGGWLHHRDPGRRELVRHLLPSPEHGALSLRADRAGRLWVGTYRGGLHGVDPERGAVVATYRHVAGDPGSLSNDEVWAIAEDSDGTLLLATNAGVDRFDPAQGRVVARHDTPSADWATSAGVRALLFDRRGTLWVGSLGGLHRLDPGERQLSRVRPEDRRLHRDGVVSLHEDRGGRLWIGTFGGGLKSLDTATGALATYEGLPSNVVYGIQEDSRGRLWASTNRGLARLDPKSGRVETFDLSNGLQSLQFSLGASYRARDRRLLFGSVDGFYEFDPDAVVMDDFAPRVVLTGVRLANQPMPLAVSPTTLRSITLQPDDKVVTLEFAALDLVLPKRNRYAWRLLGFSESWLELGERREVTFTNLDPGDYRFEVKATNSDGVWTPRTTVGLDLVVLPPFWSTWWFRGLAGLLVAAAATAVHRARVHHVTARWVERQRAELAVRQAQEKYRELFENAAEGIFQALPEGTLVTANPALARMLGAESPAELLAAGAALAGRFTVDPDRRREFLRLLAEEDGVQAFECALLRADQPPLWIAATVRAVRDGAGTLVRYEGTVQDISERKRSEEQIQFQAYHDALTGLPNRLLLQDRLSQALAYAQRRQGTLAVIFLDLDHFKLINDSLGHAAGDRLLREVGERLHGAVRAEDTVARVGGDEFLLLFPHLTNPRDAARMAEKVLATLADPFAIDDHELYVTASLGVALFPADGADPDVLLRNADAAMYWAKESGRNTFQLCTRELTARAGERLSLERELRRGLERGEFELFYQPQVHLASGRLVGVEALLRWRHPERGLVLPGTFIPVAEECHLIVPLGAWVLDAACRQLRAWRDAGAVDLRLSVNLSGRQLPQQDLMAFVEGTLHAHGLPADRLELEITESVAMQNAEWTQGLLRALRGLGVRLAIDDFGTGQSSLGYLRHFPLSALKIDRSFVEDIGRDPVDEAIVKAVIALAHSVDLTVVAEGVGSEEQLAFLRKAGCDEGQGYLFSKPLPADELQARMLADLLA
jgi:diguanylate cyclase (GGDEF)-like protein/PAS domain S-box-containing protein